MSRELNVFEMTYKKGNRTVTLTKREYQITFVLSEGRCKLQKLAKMMGVKPKTLEVHIYNLRNKLSRLKESLVYSSKDDCYSLDNPVELRVPCRRKR